MPSLSELRIGYNSFNQVNDVTLQSLPQLLEASIDERGIQTSLSSLTKAFMTHAHPIYLHNTIIQIILPSSQYNSLTHLHMLGFPSLQLLQFGSSSFMGLTSFHLSNLPSLQVLNIGSSSLYGLSDLLIESMMNWIWLDWIDLPSLGRINIQMNGLYCNGNNAHMTMKSMFKMIEYWWIIDLPVLMNLTSTGNTFRGIRYVTIESKWFIIMNEL